MYSAWVAALCLLAAYVVDAATFTVTSTSSSLADVNSLAYALSAANTNPGPDVVIVALPPAARDLISLTAFLPSVTGPIELLGGGVTINGSLLVGFSAGLSLDTFATNSSVSNVTFANFPSVGVSWAASDGRMMNVTVFGCREDGLQLIGNRNIIANAVFGSSTANGRRGNGDDGIQISGTGNVIRASVISGNAYGLFIFRNSNVVKDSIIGLDLAGKVALGNAGSGIWCSTGSDNTTIANNTVSGNLGAGVLLSSHSNVVRDNIIGLDMAGKVALGNAGSGIWCSTDSDNTTIANNTISGNLGTGVTLSSRNNVVHGNIIGLDVAGKVSLGNAGSGIQCSTGSDSTTIANNTISGNLGTGVTMSSRNNVVRGNIIGLDAAGKEALGNHQDGIQCSFFRSDNAAITSNIISGNLGHGVDLQSFSGLVRGNIIGLDKTGRVALGNALDGIWCHADSDSAIIANNTVSGNMGNGLYLSRVRSSMVQGNIIGLDVTGKVELGNAGNGIFCDNIATLN